MTRRQVEKELDRQAVLFEEKCQTGQFLDGNITLAEFSERWFKDYAEKQLKERSVQGYKGLMPRILKALGHPLAFFVNDLIFINYELIDYESGIPLKKDEIFGRKNNYNILLTEKIYYFDENEFQDSSDKISDIIFHNIVQYFELIGNNKFTVDNFSFIHNIFVIAEKIENLEKYFLDVLGATDLEID